MYNVITSAGNIQVKTLTEAMEYEKLYGYPYQKIISAPEPRRHSLRDDEKRRAVLDYYRTKSKEELVSLISLLFTNDDITSEYRGLPKSFKS